MNPDPIFERFREIVPNKKLSDMSIDSIIKDTQIAFKVIGFSPKNFSESFKSVWRHRTTDVLFEFIYDVYMEDKK